jgi:hypothetical protein
MINIKFKIDPKELMDIAKGMEKDLYMEYGYFKDHTLNEPGKGLKSLGKGIKAKEVGNSVSGSSQVALSSKLEDKYGFLSKPAHKDSSERQEVIEELISYKIYGNKESKKKLLEATKAMILAPILHDKYGRNSEKTAKDKGFNKFLISTGDTIKRLQVKLNKKEVIHDNGKI